ncbi:uracil-DNA glycosylase [Candidatus Nomurabacteria bacterium]|uniref:Uracil-DNA glycosylase n=1 Tax=Candidatus Dojkabacteria bacterium TaxID=2099670 RepID=A0A955I1Z7_9BACT|nr:uracil-DNA glycosylase [Candidatus Dojkabacteria bacterium]MCB9790210.1 uracil-DNA glycosylase [Candidatus Nomurabacteria bacterium]MCB9803270.1 uracil-DNA glycosylase [Candidatus Nomurabacteria bacterium]
MIKIEQSWQELLKDDFQSEYFRNLIKFIKQEYRSHTVYPPGPKIFNAFDSCPLEKVKVVILGQDPYHGPKQANGLSFSVSKDLALPPSLQNIYKEIEDDLGISVNKNGDLSRWAKQGVLLLNATLTVREGQAGSHQGKGWEEFTDAVVRKLSDEKTDLVFLLWGSYAQKKGEVIDEEKHYVLRSAHPSPLSAHRGFFGNKHFSKTNKFLILKDIEPIDWN